VGRVGVLFAVRLRRPIDRFDGIHPAGYFDDRRAVERPGELFDVDGCGCDQELQVLSQGQQILQGAEGEIDIQAPFMRFVDDDRIVAVQKRIRLHFHQQDAVGHELDERLLAGSIFETDLVSDGSPEGLAEFFGDPLGDGDGGDAPRLGASDHSPEPSARLDAEFRNLRGLPGSGLAGDDHDLMRRNRRNDLPAPCEDGQRRRVAENRTGGLPRVRLFRGRADTVGQIPEIPQLRVRRIMAGEAAEAPLQR